MDREYSEHELNKNEMMQEVMADEVLSDDTLIKLASFRKNIEVECKDIDRRDEGVVNRFLDDAVNRFNEENDLNNNELAEVRALLKEGIMLRESGFSQKGKEWAPEKIESMREIVQPNVESASINYMKFVQPFEGTRLFQDELKVFRKHQEKYLAEDLGIVNPQERESAMKILMQMVNERIAGREPVQRKKAETIQIQKKLSWEWIERLVGSYEEISGTESVDDFWSEASQSMRETKGLNEDDLKKVVMVVRANVEKIVQNRISSKEEAATKSSKKEEVSVADLKKKMIEKFGILSQKREALKKSQDAIRQKGIEMDFQKVQEETLSVFEDDYNIAHKEYVEALAKKEKEQKDRIFANCKKMDEVTEKRAEENGAKRIFDKASSWAKKMSARVKRVATITFVAVGLVATLSGTIGKDRSADMVDAYIHGDGQSKIEQVDQRGSGDGNVNAEIHGQLAHADFVNDSLGRELPALDEGVVDEFEQVQEVEVEDVHASERGFEKNIVDVEDNDTLWDIIEKQLDKNKEFQELNNKQKIIAIDALKDQFAKMSVDHLKGIGFESGDIDKIYNGNSLNLTEIMSDPMKIKASIERGRVFGG